MSYGLARAASSAAAPSLLLVDLEALAPQHERDDVAARRDRRRRRGCSLRAHAAGTSSRTRACSSTIRTRVPSPGRRVELDAAAEAAHRLPHDREPEPEALGVAILAAVEAVEDVPLRLGAHADAGVLDLDRTVCPPPYARNTIRPARVCFAAFSPRFRSACSRRSRFDRRQQRRRRTRPRPRRRRRAELVGDLLQQRRERHRLDARPLLAACARASVSSARASRASRSASRSMWREETVALDGVVLRARLQHLDRADDRRQRRAQLVRRVRDELALGELAPLLLGQVVEHDQHRVALGLRRDADDARAHARRRACTCACASDASASKSPRREARAARSRATAPAAVALAEPAAEHAPRLGVREVHDEIRSTVTTPSCSRSSSMRSRSRSPSMLAERASQLPSHALEALRERAELVAEAVAKRRLEVAERDRLGRRREPAQPQRDQLREQQARRARRSRPRSRRRGAPGRSDADRRRDVGTRGSQRDERHAAASGIPTTTMPPSLVLSTRAVARAAPHAAPRLLQPARSRTTSARGAFATSRPSEPYTKQVEIEVLGDPREPLADVRPVDVLRGERRRCLRASCSRVAPERVLRAGRELRDDDRRRDGGHDARTRLRATSGRR